MATNKTKVERLRSTRALLYLALVFAVVAGVFVFVALNQSGDDEKEAVTPGVTTSSRQVVVAGEDIHIRTEVTEGMLTTKTVPEDEALQGAYSDYEPVVGQVTRQDILKGEQVTRSKVGPQTDEEIEQGLSFVIAAGMRGFSIKVDETSAVGGLLLPGDLVDVIGVFDDEDDFDVDKAVTLLQNIEVLAVAQESQEAIPAPAAADEEATPVAEDGATAEAASQQDSLGTRPEDVETKPKAKTVTLAVTPEQAQLLALSQAQGELVLALRPFGDAAEVGLNETTLLPMGARPGGQ
jgi:pilus assembly protein CpaB